MNGNDGRHWYVLQIPPYPEKAVICVKALKKLSTGDKQNDSTGQNSLAQSTTGTIVLYPRATWAGRTAIGFST